MQKKLRLSGTITAPLCKGSCRRKPTEGLFLQPFHHFVVPLPLHRGGEFRTPLGEACKRASHTRKSLQPLRGFRTRLGDACKRASHTCKSLYTREPFLIKSRLCRTTSLRFSLLSQKSPAEAELFCLCHHIDVVIPLIRYFGISAGI